MKTALATIILLSITLGMVAVYPDDARRALSTAGGRTQDLGGLTIIRKNPPKADRLIPTTTSRPAKEFSI